MDRCIIVRLLSLLRSAHTCFNVCMATCPGCTIVCDLEFLFKISYSLVECFSSYVLFAITLSSNTVK
jgi:hypothetical protein